MTENLIRKVYGKPWLVLLLKAVSALTVLAAAAAFIAMGTLAYLESAVILAEYLAILALPFISVSLIRKQINAPRPYELYGFPEKPPHKGGGSFPSRHVFSAFLIGTLGLFLSPLFVILLILGVSLAISRVLLGIHFIRDTVAGALLGSVSALIGVLAFSIL